jgi:ribosomal protein L31E
VKIFGVFHDSDVRHFLTAACLFSLFLGGLSAPIYGLGKKEIQITVSQPKGINTTSGHEWLLVMVQRTLADRLNKPDKGVTAILDSSPPPHPPYVKYTLTGSLSRTVPDSFVLEFNIIADKDGKNDGKNDDKSKIFYTQANCTLEDLMNTSAVNTAALKLLEKLRVKLTKDDVQELLSNEPTQAEIALYKGIAAAKRSGNTVATGEEGARAKVEALYYFSEAKALNPGPPLLREASDEFDRVVDAIKAPSPAISPIEPKTASIQGKTIKDTIAEWNRFKSDQERERISQRQQDTYKNTLLQKYEELILYLGVCVNFYNEYPPFEIHYDDINLEREGDIDYDNGTADIKFRISMAPVQWKLRPLEIINAALENVRTTMRTEKIAEDKNLPAAAWKDGTFKIDAELYNAKDEVIGEITITFSDQLPGSAAQIPVGSNKNPQRTQDAVFKRVKIDAMTESLRVKIKSVNGMIINGNDESDNTNHITVRQLNFNTADSASGLSGQGEENYGKAENGQDAPGAAEDEYWSDNPA